MKFYYPKNSAGEVIGFKTAESLVFDKLGISLTDKLSKAEEKSATKDELNVEKKRIDNLLSASKGSTFTTYTLPSRTVVNTAAASMEWVSMPDASDSDNDCVNEECRAKLQEIKNKSPFVIGGYGKYASTNSSGGVLIREGTASFGTIKSSGMVSVSVKIDMSDYKSGDNIELFAIIGYIEDNDNSEVTDIRTGADGVIYDSAGTAIRDQLKDKVSFKKCEKVIGVSSIDSTIDINDIKADVNTLKSDTSSHYADQTRHITASERTAWNSKAAGNHKHSADDITSGTLGVARGGTGVTSYADLLSKIGMSDSKTTLFKSENDGNHNFTIRMENGLQIYAMRRVCSQDVTDPETIYSYEIDFPKPFAYAPICVCTCHTGTPDKFHASVNSTSSTSVNIEICYHTDIADRTVSLICIGLWK